MRGEVLEGVERLRRRSDKQKLSVLMGVGVRGATVSGVSRQHEVTRQQIYSWRQELKRHGALWPDDRPVFLPIGPPPMLPSPTEPAAAAPSADPVSASATTHAIEIVLSNGHRICFAGDTDDAALAQLIRLLEAV